jgi:hydroxymethylpyrimidine/phosphomethylpyrimidine kinase
MKPATLSAILTIGGLDPTGGAGILVDAAAARCVGVHTAAVLTVSTVQDGNRFISAEAAEASSVRSAMEAVLGSVKIGAIKTGALGSADIVGVVAEYARRKATPPVVVDPVVASTTGGALLDDKGVRLLRDELLRNACLVTPNLGEAEILTLEKIEDVSGMLGAARRLIDIGAGAALIKGGHLESQNIADVFVDRRGREKIFHAERHAQTEVRGTGCALASMIAGLIAKGHDVLEAVAMARPILSRAILEAREIGPGPRILGLCTNLEIVQSNEHGSDKNN